MSIIQQLVATITAIITFFAGPSTHIEGIVGQPQDINPLAAYENPIDRDITALVFEGLVRLDGNGNPKPGLAKSWEILEDGETYIFHLKENATFHDRTQLKAEDIIYTASKAPQLKDVEMEKIDEHTVKFKLGDPFAPFLHLMSLGILPQHLEGKTKSLNPVGAGPYRISKIVKGTRRVESITLAKFQKDHPGPERIVFKFFEKEENLLTAAKLEEVDGFSSPKFSWKSFSSQTMPLNGRYFSLVFNPREKEALKDKKFRETLARLCPRERIINEALEGEGVPLHGPLQTTWARAEIEPYLYNPEPKETWDEEVSLTIPDTLEHRKTADILAAEWKKAGIETKILPQEPPRIKNETIPQRNFEILLVGQVVGRDPDRYNLWHSTQADGGMNISGYKNMRADRALEEGRKAQEQEERRKHYENFQTVFMEDLPAIFLYQPTYTYHLQKSRGELDLSGIFTPEERWKRILQLYP